MTENKTVKVQYHTVKEGKKGGKIQNCRISLTKSIIEQMGFYEGGNADVTYDLTNNKIIITPAED